MVYFFPIVSFSVTVGLFFDVVLFFIWLLKYPLDIFLKCILLVILFCGTISSVSEEAGCSDQRNVKNNKLNFDLMTSFLIVN